MWGVFFQFVITDVIEILRFKQRRGFVEYTVRK